MNSMCFLLVFFFFKQKTAYEMRISDWSSDVCSSDLGDHAHRRGLSRPAGAQKGDEGTGLDRQGDFVHCHHRAVPIGPVLQPDAALGVVHGCACYSFVRMRRSMPKIQRNSRTTEPTRTNWQMTSDLAIPENPSNRSDQARLGRIPQP